MLRSIPVGIARPPFFGLRQFAAQARDAGAGFPRQPASRGEESRGSATRGRGAGETKPSRAPAGAGAAGPRMSNMPSDSSTAPLFQRLIHLRRVANVTKEGKHLSYSVLVVVGDRNGSAGYALGKASHPTKAVRKALERAEKNMVFFDRYDARTIYHDLEAKAGRTLVLLRTASAGHGIRTNNYIHEICRCIGIQDIGAKCHGATNPLNIVRGTFMALEKQRTPEEIGFARGKRVFDLRKSALA